MAPRQLLPMLKLSRSVSDFDTGENFRQLNSGALHDLNFCMTRYYAINSQAEASKIASELDVVGAFWSLCWGVSHQVDWPSGLFMTTHQWPSGSCFACRSCQGWSQIHLSACAAVPNRHASSGH